MDTNWHSVTLAALNKIICDVFHLIQSHVDHSAINKLVKICHLMSDVFV